MSESSGVRSPSLKVACLCRAVTGHIQFVSSEAPRNAFVCHCFACRHTSGVLCTTVISTSTHPFTIEVDGQIQSYSPSPTTTLFFCEHCGSSIFERNDAQKEFAFHTGVLEDPNGTIKIQNQCCASETKDGGLSAWLDLRSENACLFHDDVASAKGPVENPSVGPEIQAFCHCKGVHIKITPPSEASAQLWSPYSDLIVPFYSGSPANENNEKWWLRANGTKYFAGTCACTNCRLACGNDVQTWAFIPKVNIRQVNGEPLDFSMGTLKQYESTKGKYRNFCGTCGATVFWHDDTRPHLIDVSVGLLDAKSGARAEELLEWATERVSFQEDAQNKDLIARLGAGIRAWARPKGALNAPAS